jgi:hypothetical protein
MTASMAPAALRPFPAAQLICSQGAGGPILLYYSLHYCSVRCMKDLTVRQARELLIAWAADRDAVASRRDDVVRAVVAAGLSKSEVHRLTGIARSTLDRIVGPARPPAAGGGAAA